MAYEMKDGQGSLFKNDRRESENHPNLKGKIMIDGKLYWLSAWRKTGMNGAPDWLSLAATPADKNGGSGERRAPTPDDDDLVPF